MTISKKFINDATNRTQKEFPIYNKIFDVFDIKDIPEGMKIGHEYQDIHLITNNEIVASVPIILRAFASVFLDGTFVEFYKNGKCLIKTFFVGGILRLDIPVIISAGDKLLFKTEPELNPPVNLAVILKGEKLKLVNKDEPIYEILI